MEKYGKDSLVTEFIAHGPKKYDLKISQKEIKADPPLGQDLLAELEKLRKVSLFFILIQVYATKFK